MIDLTRRGFLPFVALAPAIVRASSLMSVKVWRPEPKPQGALWTVIAGRSVPFDGPGPFHVGEMISFQVFGLDPPHYAPGATINVNGAEYSIRSISTNFKRWRNPDEAILHIPRQL